MNTMLALMAAVTLATQWKDIPDTNTVGSVLDLGNGPTAVTNAANGAIAKYDETNLTARINAKYAKPNGGIPMSDLASALQTTIYGKQDALVSGTNIKTINNQSILGPGNIVIEGGGSGGTSNYNLLNNKPIVGGKTVEGSHGISYYGGVTAQSATNITDAIIASSNLCTVAAAQAMTNAKADKATTLEGYGITDAYTKTYNDLWFVKKDASGRVDYLDARNAFVLVDLTVGGHIYKNDEWGNPQDVTTFGDVTNVVASSSVTNAGAVAKAKAYADATCVKYSSTYGSMYVMTNEIAFSGYNYRPVILSKDGISFAIDTNRGGSATNNIGITFSGAGPSPRGEYRLSCDPNGIAFVSDDIRGSKHNYLTSYLVPDGTPVATSNMVERVIASKPAPSPLTGKTYDFANGVNFTKNLYTALTNVIQTLGGTVTNPPNFTP